MRLWSIHPRYLDSKGLVALWSEALLAQKVLWGGTKGFKNHPQLTRFKTHLHPRRAIADYLSEVWRESRKRQYNFQKTKIGEGGLTHKIPVKEGQLKHEFRLLLGRLRKRDPKRYRELRSVKRALPHPIFIVVEGEIEDWEKTKV
jgi:hypothetical protein